MDGIDVLKVLKKMLPSLQVIMLTGHGSERAARDGLTHGAFDYLIKPIGIETLVDTILAAVAGGAAPAAE
jgi:DNA-binding NtrC family response regulator